MQYLMKALVAFMFVFSLGTCNICMAHPGHHGKNPPMDPVVCARLEEKIRSSWGANKSLPQSMRDSMEEYFKKACPSANSNAHH